MRFLVLWPMVCSLALAGTSLRLPPGTTVSYSSFPALGTAPYRVELRVHDRTYHTGVGWPSIVTLPTSSTAFVASRYNSANTISCSVSNELIEATPPNGLPNDFEIRMQVVPLEGQVTCEVYDTSRSARIAYGCFTLGALNPLNLSGENCVNVLKKIPAMSAGPLVLGSRLNDSSIAFLRIRSTTVPMNSSAPSAYSKEPGDIVDYEFNGSAADTSGNARDFNVSSSSSAPTYIATPPLPPVCNAGPAKIFRAGDPIQLNSLSASLNELPLTYRWALVDAPPDSPELAWSSTSDPNPTVRNTQFGQYRFSLSVSDPLFPDAVTCNTTHGVAAADADGIITPPVPTAFQQLIGPALMRGRNPLAWADYAAQQSTEYFGSLYGSNLDGHGLKMANPDRRGTWDSDSQNWGTGTISFTTRGTTAMCDVTGTCNFVGTLCNPDGSLKNNSAALSFQYPIYATAASSRGSRGDPGSRSVELGWGYVGVAGCLPDGDTVKLSGPITYGGPAGRTITGMHWSWSDGKAQTVLSWGPANPSAIRFYDPVLAHYIEFYRTGLTKYRDYARWIADRSWESWFINKGWVWVSSSSNYNGFAPEPRDLSSTGLILRALDGRPDMWPGLRRAGDYYWSLFKNATVHDREDGLVLTLLAQLALADPAPPLTSDGTSVWKNRVAALLSGHWKSDQCLRGTENTLCQYFTGHYGTDAYSAVLSVPQGKLTTLTGVFISSYYSEFRANVTNGSDLVTFNNLRLVDYQTGALLTLSSSNLAYFWRLGDNKAYRFTVVDAATIRLRDVYDQGFIPYVGPTGTAVRFSITPSVYTGGPSVIFQNGIMLRGLAYAIMATDGDPTPSIVSANADGRSILRGLRSFVLNYGLDPRTRGAYYERAGALCEDGADVMARTIPANNPCSSPSRGLLSTILGGIALAQLVEPDPQAVPIIDDMYGAAFGRAGYKCDAPFTSYCDGNYGVEVLTWLPGYYQYNTDKYLGEWWGIGGGQAWPAVRKLTNGR